MSHEDFDIKFKIEASVKKDLNKIKEQPDEPVKGERKEMTLYNLFLSEFEACSKIYQLTQSIRSLYGHRPGGSGPNEFITPFADPAKGIPPLAFIHSKFPAGDLLSFVLNPYIIRVIPDDRLEELALQDEYKDILKRLCFVFQYVDWNPFMGVRDLIKFEYTNERERMKRIRDYQSQAIKQNYQQRTYKPNFSSREEYFAAKQRAMWDRRQNRQDLQIGYTQAKQDLMQTRREYAEKYKALAPLLHYYANKQIKPLRSGFKGYVGSLMLIDNGGKAPKTGTLLNWNFYMGDLGGSRVFSPVSGKLESGKNIIPIFIRSSRKNEFLEKISKRVRKLLDKVQYMLFDNPMIFFEESQKERDLIMNEINEEVDKIVSPWFWDDIEGARNDSSEEDINDFITEDLMLDFLSDESDTVGGMGNSANSTIIQPGKINPSGKLDGFNRKS